MKILLIFRFFDYALFIDSENLCFILILKEENDKVLTYCSFPELWIERLPLTSTISNFNKRQGRLLEEIRYLELLGVTIDKYLRIKKHIKNLCRNANCKLHTLIRIRKHLTIKKAKLLGIMLLLIASSIMLL